MESSSSKLGSGEINRNVHVSNPSSKLKAYGFAIAIILGIALLAVGGAGLAGYFQVGAISNLSQIHAIIMMAMGVGGILIIGMNCAVKNNLKNRREENSEQTSPSLGTPSTQESTPLSKIKKENPFKENPPLDEQANGEALYQLMTPKARELTPLVIKQVPHTATLANNRIYNLNVSQYDWVSTLGRWPHINLTMPCNFSYSFSQLDVSPFIGLTCLILENCNGELPKGIEKLPLRELHLKNAELESLPEYFCQFGLKVLQLDGCIIDRIPDVVFTLSSLEQLQINNLKNRSEANVPIKLILDDETCSKLKALPNLKVLKIVNSGWQDDDLNDLKQKLSPIDIVLQYSSLELELQQIQKDIFNK